MKILIGGIVGLLGSVIIILLDIKMVKWIFTLIPQTDWMGLIRVVIVIIDIWLTVGICILPFMLGVFIGSSLERRS